MSAHQIVVADGSSPADAHPTVRIDRSKPGERYRYTCPNNHTSWEAGARRIFCGQCAWQDKHSADVVETRHAEVIDKKTGETIPWSAVELVGE